MVMLPYHTKVLVGGYIRINMGNTGATSFQYDSLFAGWYLVSKKDKTVFLKIDLCFITFCMTSPHSQCCCFVSSRITWTELFLLLNRGENLHFFFVLQSEWGSHCEGLESLIGEKGLGAQLSLFSSCKSDCNLCVRNSFGGVHITVSPPFLHQNLSWWNDMQASIMGFILSPLQQKK